MSLPVPTPVFDTYWRWIAERQAMYERRLHDPVGPWTDDPILASHRFTNVYRVSDRVSQRLVRDVQWGESRPRDPREVFYRTILFKTWNREDVWDAIERELGPVTVASAPPEAVERVLDRMHAQGRRVYSAAYIMPSPPFGRTRKHGNHCALIRSMLDGGVAEAVASSSCLEEVYDVLIAMPGMGRFLAFQYAVDLNYSPMVDHPESDFVVAGPGAVDGLSKCFSDLGGMGPERAIMWIHDRQELEFARLGISFGGLFGRPLQPIDLQNCLCEISKYARVAHPEHPGSAGRTRIKQAYAHAGRAPLERPFLPPKWGVTVPAIEMRAAPPPRQADLFVFP